jgi:hypothetical protein
VLNIVSFLLDLITKHVIWLYLACLVVVIFYVRAYSVARRDRHNTIFTIEKEVAAHREGQAMSSVGIVLGVVVVITVLKFYLVPSIDLSAVIEPTPTLTLPVPTRAMPTPTWTLTPTLTIAAIPTSRPSPTLTPETKTPTLAASTPVPPAAACSDANGRIVSPGANATLAGRVGILGTATHDRFQFFKVEYSQGERPGVWNGVNNIHRVPVINGVLEEFDTTALPNGVYWLQLTVVDQSGNFPPPCRVRIVIQN